jgi:hypothetical protein
MTIRIEHLTIEDDAQAWLRAPADGTDMLDSNVYYVELLSVVRHIMRERGDCSIIPIIRAATTHPRNEWGHNGQVEVTYSKRGYRAIYGFLMGADGVSNVQCYMD